MKKPVYCSFCGKSQHEVTHMVASPHTAAICNECVDLAYDLCHQPSPGDVEYASWFRTEAA